MIDLKESDVAQSSHSYVGTSTKILTVYWSQLETGKRDGWRIEVKFSESIWKTKEKVRV